MPGPPLVVPLAGGAPLAEYPGEVDALVFAGEELWVSHGGAVAPAGSLQAGTQAPIRALAGAAGGAGVLALGAADELRCTSAGRHHDLAPGRRGRAGDLAVR